MASSIYELSEHWNDLNACFISQEKVVMSQESSNDLDLEWPWDKQWFKFIVQDQVPDVLFRMDQNRVRAIQEWLKSLKIF